MYTLGKVYARQNSKFTTEPGKRYVQWLRCNRDKIEPVMLISVHNNDSWNMLPSVENIYKVISIRWLISIMSNTLTHIWGTSLIRKSNHRSGRCGIVPKVGTWMVFFSEIIDNGIHVTWWNTTKMHNVTEGTADTKIGVRFMNNALNNSNWSSAPKIKYASHNAKKNKIKVKL